MKALLARHRRVVSCHLALVDPIARKLLIRMPATVECDDLVQAGRIGLMDAAVRYDRATGVPFIPYARMKIRWAMLSAIRNSEWRHLTMMSFEAPPTGDDDDPALDNAAGGACDGTVDAIHERQVAEQLARAVDLLPAIHAYVVRAMYWDRRQPRSVAAYLRIPLARLESIHAEALQNLARQHVLSRLAC